MLHCRTIRETLSQPFFFSKFKFLKNKIMFCSHGELDASENHSPTENPIFSAPCLFQLASHFLYLTISNIIFIPSYMHIISRKFLIEALRYIYIYRDCNKCGLFSMEAPYLMMMMVMDTKHHDSTYTYICLRISHYKYIYISPAHTWNCNANHKYTVCLDGMYFTHPNPP